MSGQVGSGRSSRMGQLAGGIAITLISIGLLLGGFLLSQMDALGVQVSPTQTDVVVYPSLTPLPTVVPPSSLPSVTAIASTIPSATEPSVVVTETPPPTSPPLVPTCLPPAGWVVYIVQRGDTLYRLAWRSGSTTFALMQANCLSTSLIYVGQRLYLPPAYNATATPPPYPCGPPPGWVVYIVQPKDTLYSLSRRFGVSIEEIRWANCLTTYQINIGQPLYLPPPPPTHTPTFTPTFSPTPTLTPTATGTPTPSLTPTPTLTPTSTAVLTPTLTPTVVLTPTMTPTPSAIPTLIPTLGPPTATVETPTPTDTLTPTPETPTSTTGP